MADTDVVGNLEYGRSKWLTWCAVPLLLIAFLASLLFNQQHSEWLGIAGLVLMATFLLAFIHWSFSDSLNANAPLILVWGFWLCWMLASWFSPVQYVSETTLWSMVVLPVSATATFWLIQYGKAFWPYFYHALTLIVLLMAFHGCYQFFVEYQPPRATFINKNNFAALQMLVLLLTLGRYLTLDDRGSRSVYPGFLLLVLLVLSYVIGLIGSRGALLALMCGVIFILIAGRVWQLSGRRLGAALGIIVVGLLIANLTNMGELGQRIASLQSPFEVGSGAKRVIIWSGSVEMLGQAMPLGIGPGLYWLLYPQYRLPDDTDGGFYVHNDYLQFVIEAGPAALVLFVLLAAVITLRAFRLARQQSVSVLVRMETMTLLASLSALTGHSLLTFNLYMVPILLVVGAIIGRLAFLLAINEAQSRLRRPARKSVVLFMGVAVLLVWSSAVFYTKAIGGGYALKAAMYSAGSNQWQSAAKSYQKAISFWDEVDVYHYSYAWALFESGKNPTGVPDEEKVKEALAQLNIAQELNPYRPQPYFLRGRIYEAIRLPGDDDEEQLEAIVDQYEQAMALDPRYLDARFRLARLLLGRNRIEQGVAVLEGGLIWPYPNSELKQQFYRLTAEMRRILGDQEGYAELIERSRAVATGLARQAERQARPGLL